MRPTLEPGRPKAACSLLRSPAPGAAVAPRVAVSSGDRDLLMSSDFLHFAQVEKSSLPWRRLPQCPYLSSSNPILFCRILGCVPHPKPSLSLPHDLQAPREPGILPEGAAAPSPVTLTAGTGAPLECTEVLYPNRPAFNKWTCGVGSEEKSHLLTFSSPVSGNS